MGVNGIFEVVARTVSFEVVLYAGTKEDSPGRTNAEAPEGRYALAWGEAERNPR
jgi:hypothetical protein